MAAWSAMVSGVTARQAVSLRDAFNGPFRVLTQSSKRQCQSRNGRAETRGKTRGVVMTKLPVKAEAKPGEGARVA